MTNAEKMVEFLNHCHSAFHSTMMIENELIEAGFIKLYENESWKLESNRYYYVTRNDTSIIAFKIPEILNVKSLNIVASHSDSPTFKIKPVATLKDGHYGKLNVEAYGGGIYYTWLDKPLSIAGRAIVKDEGKLVSKLVDFDEDMAIIPSVAIHQNREANNGYKWNVQTDLIPMVGEVSDEKFLIKKIAEEVGCQEEDVMSYDMYLYNRQPGYVWGPEKEFISSARLDDLECAYTSLQAFKHSFSVNSINILAVFDNEEVGSMSRQGMGGNFLSSVINRIFASFFYSATDAEQIIANSFMISADNAHAAHPNHPELYDVANRCYMNGGVVIKRNAAQSYVTDAVSEAILRTICERSETPYQFFANRSDVRGGGTQASIASIHLAAMAVDIGLPQLAMHSSFETAGSKDVDYMIDMLIEFYNSTIIVNDKEINIVK